MMQLKPVNTIADIAHTMRAVGLPHVDPGVMFGVRRRLLPALFRLPDGSTVFVVSDVLGEDLRVYRLFRHIETSEPMVPVRVEILTRAWSSRRRVLRCARLLAQGLPLPVAVTLARSAMRNAPGTGADAALQVLQRSGWDSMNTPLTTDAFAMSAAGTAAPAWWSNALINDSVQMCGSAGHTFFQPRGAREWRLCWSRTLYLHAVGSLLFVASNRRRGEVQRFHVCQFHSVGAAVPTAEVATIGPAWPALRWAQRFAQLLTAGQRGDVSAWPVQGGFQATDANLTYFALTHLANGFGPT